MKFDLSQKDQQQFQSDLTNNPIMKYLQAKESLRFNIGDVLIRQQNRFGPHNSRKWVTDCVSAHSQAPKKFVYVYENELGVGYVKQLKADGSGFTSYMCCMANIDPTYTRFIIDPEYADHLLLTDGVQEFTPGDQFLSDKQRREEIKKFNRGIAEKTSTCGHVNDAIAKIQVGQDIWFGSGLVNATELTYKVLSKSKSYSAYPMDDSTKECYELELEFVDIWGSKRKTRIDTNRLRNQRLFLVKPKSLKDEQ